MNIDALKQTNQQIRQNFRDDPHRPQYHYMPPANWLNDPNGLIQWNGLYHLFYQYNPEGAFHHRIHWGHAVSADLVHWEDWPVALVPTAGHFDQDGCWSGCAVNHAGVPTLFYSGVYPQSVCMATSADNLLTWHKHPNNPVITGPPPEINSEGEFRDPFVWQEADGWYMLMGSRSAETGGVILLYRSDDLLNWEYLHPLLRGDKNKTLPFWTGSVWECPNLFPLGDRHVLLVSFQHHELGKLLYTGYFVGTYENQRFTPMKEALVDYGSSFYAPQVMLDEQGRRLMWGWLREERSEAVQRQVGWSGVMTLPRVLTLDETDTLLMSPAPELETLRGVEYRLDDVTITPGTNTLLSDVQGDTLEIWLEAELQPGTHLVLTLRRTPDGAEQTTVRFDAEQQQLTVDTSQSSLDPDLSSAPVTVACPLANPNRLRLRIFLDRSVLELFAERHICLTSRVYPTRPDSTGLALATVQGSANVTRLSLWPMQSIWTT